MVCQPSYNGGHGDALRLTNTTEETVPDHDAGSGRKHLMLVRHLSTTPMPVTTSYIRC